ncbi:unnamed protein product [Porites evermanni]|uniref:Uncharacterized protein n=1 Tax=Porites evermanni TaxID=104178 RepID=A0ABN8LW67_9CNID|nr:unnamed protein product [Porites evermanni]
MRSRSPSLVQMTMVVILLGLLFADEVMSSPFIFSPGFCQLNPQNCKKRNAEIPGKGYCYSGVTLIGRVPAFKAEGPGSIPGRRRRHTPRWYGAPFMDWECD